MQLITLKTELHLRVFLCYSAFVPHNVLVHFPERTVFFLPVIGKEGQSEFHNRNLSG